MRRASVGLGLAVLAVLPSPHAYAGVDVWTRGTLLVAPVLALAIDPTNANRVYAGTSRGFFKTTDGGSRWKATLSVGSAGAIHGIVIDPSTPTIVYAAAETTVMQAGNTGTVYKSTDSGTTWFPAGTGLPAQRPTTAIAIDPTAPATLYAGTLTGEVFKTTDAGATWNAAATGLPSAGVAALVVDPSDPSTVYAATRAGVFKTTTGGTSWSLASSGMTQPDVTALAIDPADPATLYAATWYHVFKSTDFAATWNSVRIGLPPTRMQSLAVDPSSTGTVYAGTLAGVYKTEDGGATWSGVNSGVTSLSVAALAVDATGATVFAGASGLFKSNDGGAQWFRAEYGLVRVKVQDLAVDASAPQRVYAGTGGGVFKSTNEGATWRVMTSGMTSFDVQALVMDPVTPTTLYAGTSRGVFKSTNGAATWRAASDGLTPCPAVTPAPSSFHPCVTALVIDATAPSTLYAATSEGVFKTMNGGDTWTEASTGLPTLNSSPDRVATLAIDPATPATLYAGFVLGDHGVYKSEDGGNTWSAANFGLTSLDVRRLVTDPTTPTTIYAATTTQIFKSGDAAQTWGPASAAQPLAAAALAVDPVVGTTLYGSIGSAVVKSLNGGATWDVLAPRADHAVVAVVAINPVAPATIYAGTPGYVLHLRQVSPPNLRVTALPALPASAAAGGKLSAGDTVRNTGGAPTPLTETRYYLSSNATWDSGDYRFAQRRVVPDLVSGEQSSGSTLLSVPLTTIPGMYFVIACADATHTIAEAVETDNCRASSTKVTIEAVANLVMSKLSNPPGSVAGGATFPVTATTRNRGSGSAGPSTTRFYVSADATKSASDTRLLGTLAVPTLAPEATHTDTVTVTVPSAVAPGSYFLIACADDLNVVAEIDEISNCRTSSASVVVSP